MLIRNIPWIHRTLLLHPYLCTRRPRHLKNVCSLYSGHGHRSIIFRLPRCGCHRTLDWAGSLLVLLRTDFRYSFTLLDGGKQPKCLDSIQCVVWILFSWACHASRHRFPKSLSWFFEAGYSSGHELGYFVVCFAHRIAYSWCFVEESWERSKATSIRLSGSAALGGTIAVLYIVTYRRWKVGFLIWYIFGHLHPRIPRSEGKNWQQLHQFSTPLAFRNQDVYVQS